VQGNRTPVVASTQPFGRITGFGREHQIIESFLFDLRLCALFDSKELINGDKSTPNQPRIASEGEAWS